jgi:hypothetical protein
MTRPAQKWIGMLLVATSFLLMLFTLAVPYVNHFGSEVYFTKWNGRWREGNMTFYYGPGELLDFPMAASALIGLGLLVALIGAGYLFWLTYQNKSCYFTREKPGPMGGIISATGIIMYFIGSLIYEKWASGTPRPLDGWLQDPDFDPSIVRLSPTFWVGLIFAFIVLTIATINVVYYLDTRSKRPVK